MFNTRCIYVRIWANKMIIRNVVSHCEVTLNAEMPFTTNRILIGDMLSAAKTLQKGITCLYPSISFFQMFIPPKYLVLMHPKEMTDGGLSSVEIKAYRELASFSSPNNELVFSNIYEQRDDLSDNDVLASMKSAFKKNHTIK
ncbi:hypothetical protein [Providencia rettgeri]|uniref:hypothetical protein n=1 Tax=Providencia rettgeri TaxID=587 RepID=UPI003523DA46